MAIDVVCPDAGCLIVGSQVARTWEFADRVPRFQVATARRVVVALAAVTFVLAVLIALPEGVAMWGAILGAVAVVPAMTVSMTEPDGPRRRRCRLQLVLATGGILAGQFNWGTFETALALGDAVDNCEGHS